VKIFTTKETARLLGEATTKAVYLYGSNMGYANFGDILQLKNEVYYHQHQTKLIPVITLRFDAPYGFARHTENKHWYSVENICYLAKDNASVPRGWVELKKNIVMPQLLHVYGGGFLNSFWGEEMLEEIISVRDILGVKNYFFSGQQVSEGMSKTIYKRLKKNPPFTFGVRDKESLKFMQGNAKDFNVEFSFDDITELFQEWVRHKPSTVVKMRSSLRKTVLFHFNTTGYVNSSAESLQDKLRYISANTPLQCVLLQAYNDGSGEAKDTLQTVIAMENNFPYTSYKVINLAQLALEIKPVAGHYPNLAALLSGAKMAITSSYHTAMIATLLGIPSYLMVENEYYQQKQRALGLEIDFNKFMSQPILQSNKIVTQIEERQLWLKLLDKKLRSLDV